MNSYVTLLPDLTVCLFGDGNTVEKSGKSGYECSQKTREIVKKKHSVIVPTIRHVYNIVG